MTRLPEDFSQNAEKLLASHRPLAGRVQELGGKTYIGTKVLHAAPMTRREYNNLRGWTLPADENGDDAGFLVQYADQDQINVEGFTGYVSWSPAGVFSAAYQPLLKETVK